jgi:glycosyltransferase involved in cell wall biosynthesis
MKVFIFGTGQYYKDYSSMIYEREEVVGLLDNNPKKWNSTMDGRTIYNPNELDRIGIEYDRIILLSARGIEMHKQLTANGIPGERIMYWKEYNAQFHQDECTYFHAEHLSGNKKKVLIVNHALNYDGASMVAVYTAMEFQKMGYPVAIAAPKADDKLIHEFVERGISFMIRPALPYVKKENMGWVDEFDMVIVNVLPMIQCACEMSYVKPTIWWLHECSEIYPNTLYEFRRYTDERCFDNIHIFAVSEMARNNFQRYFQGANVDILTYGIPDEAALPSESEEKERFVFAVIGGVVERKAQDIFIEAANQLDCEDAEFWIIGKNHPNDYCRMVRAMADGNPAIRFLGGMTRVQMNEVFRKIDVVVCSSREECLPVTMVEGMMYGKTCIVSDHAGMTGYVDDGENGFVFESENSDELCAKMRWCIENKDKLETIGKNARNTYEEFFTMEKFGNRLEEIARIQYMIPEIEYVEKNDKQGKDHS